MKKKLALHDLGIQSFVTTLSYRQRRTIGGADGVQPKDAICGDTLCPPCTEDAWRCLISDTVCTQCVDTERCDIGVIGVN